MPMPAGTISGPLLFSTIVAALGGLLFGFDTAVISGTTDALTEVFHLDKFGLGFTVASALVGTIVGSVIVEPAVRRLGAEAGPDGPGCVLLCLGRGLCRVVGLVLAVGVPISGRSGGGRSVGGRADVHRRDRRPACGAPRRGPAIQHLLRHSPCISVELHDRPYQQQPVGVALDAGRPGVSVGLLLRPHVPHAGHPRWLVAQGRLDEALRVLSTLGTDTNGVEQEIQEIVGSLDPAHHTVAEPFFTAKYRFPILLAVAIAMFNQLSGINAVLYYAPHVFKLAGAGSDSALLQAVAVGGTNLFFTMLALLVIDRVGRRRLMIVGSIGYILSLAATAWAFYTYGTNFTPTGSVLVLTSLLVFIASHAFGQGAVIWVFISEVFPNRVRARGQALGSFTHWFMAAVITWTFPIIAERSGGHAFAFYALAMVAQLLWVLFVMPETKGVPLEEIQKKLGIE